MEEHNYKRVRIPENATLKEIIQIFNLMHLEVDVNNVNNKQWIYEHQNWFVEKQNEGP